jgi:hypothetical protein
VHIPADKHPGPDGLSRHEPVTGEDNDEDNLDDWVDCALSLGTWVLSWVERSPVSLSGLDDSTSPPPLRYSSCLQQCAHSQTLANTPSTSTSVNLHGDTHPQSADTTSAPGDPSRSGNIDPNTLLADHCSDVLPCGDLTEKADNEIATIHHFLEA